MMDPTTQSHFLYWIFDISLSGGDSTDRHSSFPPSVAADNLWKNEFTRFSGSYPGHFQLGIAEILSDALLAP